MTLTNRDLLKRFFPPKFIEIEQTQFSYEQNC